MLSFGVHWVTPADIQVQMPCTVKKGTVKKEEEEEEKKGQNRKKEKRETGQGKEGVETDMRGHCWKLGSQGRIENGPAASRE